MINQDFIDNLKRRLQECENRLNNSAAGNQHKFTKLVKEHAYLKKILGKADAFLRAKKDEEDCRLLIADNEADQELKVMAQEELETLVKKTPELERELMIEMIPPDPDNSRNTIIEIRAGTGGSEAALFAGDLLRMYTRYAETKGWKTELINASPSEIGGYKEVVFSVHGDNVYKTFQFEGGTHRVQRIPVTEASGRIHTSAATVAVLPEAEDIDDIDIKPEDLRVDVYRASGAGGQHVNKTDSAVRITHLPTGIVAACQEERSQHKNRAKAMRVLRSHLLAARRRQADEQMENNRRVQIGSGDRSARIRTYNFPQNRLTDHRINFTIYNLEKMMEGELDALMKALDVYYTNKSLEKVVAVHSLS